MVIVGNEPTSSDYVSDTLPKLSYPTIGAGLSLQSPAMSSWSVLRCCLTGLEPAFSQSYQDVLAIRRQVHNQLPVGRAAL